jgi:hypothetical protein
VEKAVLGALRLNIRRRNENVTHTDLYPLAVGERNQIVNQLAFFAGLL